jgi:hypothetical protein
VTLDEWKAIAIFGLGVYALSFFSTNAAMFLLVTVGVAAFVTRYYQTRGTTGAPGGSQPTVAGAGSS